MTNDEKIARVTDALLGGHRTWIEDLARTIGVEFDELMEHADKYLVYDEYWSEGGRFEGVHLPEEFWDHYEALKAVQVPADKRWSFFSCSC